MQGKMAVRFGAWALSLIAGLAAFCACGAFSAMSSVFLEHPVLGVVIELLSALLVSFIFKRLYLLGASRFVRDATVRQFAMEGGRLWDAHMARALHRATLGSISSPRLWAWSRCASTPVSIGRDTRAFLRTSEPRA